MTTVIKLVLLIKVDLYVWFSWKKKKIKGGRKICMVENKMNVYKWRTYRTIQYIGRSLSQGSDTKPAQQIKTRKLDEKVNTGLFLEPSCEMTREMVMMATNRVVLTLIPVTSYTISSDKNESQVKRFLQSVCLRVGLLMWLKRRIPKE